jgi:cobalt/nickel-transporting P-type ATPase D
MSDHGILRAGGPAAPSSRPTGDGDGPVPASMSPHLSVSGSSGSSGRGPVSAQVRRLATPAGAAVGSAVALVAGAGADLAGGAQWLWAPVYCIGIVVGGWRPAQEGIRALGERRLDVDLLMVVAAVAAVGLGEWRDAGLLIVIFAASGALEEAATARTVRGVRALLIDQPDTAEVLGTGSGEPDRTVDATALRVGDRVLVRPGGRVPADGVVVDGAAAVDESDLTGESLPASRHPGGAVLAGSTVIEGHLVVEVTVDPAGSVLARLAAAVHEAVEQRPAAQLAIERFGQRYAVVVVVSALAVAAAGPLLGGWETRETVVRTMTFLVVASPCALVLAMMPATLSALATAARQRVLIRGGAVLERLATLDVMAFDKTGTLTVGAPVVTGVVPAGDRAVDEVLALAAAVERWSEHPVGRAVVAEAARRSLVVPDARQVTATAGFGVQGVVDGHRVAVGGAGLVGQLPSAPAGETVVGVRVGDDLAGVVHLRDELRPRAACAVACLGRSGVSRVVMLTGDHAEAAGEIARLTGIDTVRSRLLPHDKVSAVRDLAGSASGVGFVGDGVNDAAALASSTVGVSLGQRGTALAVDAADLVILDDDLHRLPDMVGLARRTRRVVRQNLTVALTGIVVLVVLSLTGRLPLVVGVLAHEGSSVLVALNGLRLLGWRPAPH